MQKEHTYVRSPSLAISYQSFHMYLNIQNLISGQLYEALYAFPPPPGVFHRHIASSIYGTESVLGGREGETVHTCTSTGGKILGEDRSEGASVEGIKAMSTSSPVLGTEPFRCTRKL